jgi:uncharacterized DUF497 family protein
MLVPELSDSRFGFLRIVSFGEVHISSLVIMLKMWYYLAKHGVTFEEAVDCFYFDFQIRRNKSYRDRYQLVDRARGGRRLKIIFQLKPNRVVRIITGWQI